MEARQLLPNHSLHLFPGWLIVSPLHDGWQLSTWKKCFSWPQHWGQIRWGLLSSGRWNYTFTLFQSLNCSPSIRVAHATLPEELEMLKFPQEVTVRQCISDGGGGCFTKPVKTMDTCDNTATVSWGRDTIRTGTRAQSWIHLLGSQTDRWEKNRCYKKSKDYHCPRIRN